MESSRPSAPARPTALRRAWAPLTAYHVLVLAGGCLVAYGILSDSPVLVLAGAPLLIAGLIVVLAVLWWTAGLARRGASDGAAPGEAGRMRTVPQWICPRCGRTGAGSRFVCPRCGAPLGSALRTEPGPTR
jgi:hypothetical protein